MGAEAEGRVPAAPELLAMQSRWPALQYELLQLSPWVEENPETEQLDMVALERLMDEEVERMNLLGIRRAFLGEARSALKDKRELTDLVRWCLNRTVSDREAVGLVRRFVGMARC